MFDRDDRRQSFSDVVAGQAAYVLQQFSGLSICVHRPGQGTLQPGQVSASIGVVDDVGEAVNRLRVRIGPLHGDLNLDLALVAVFGSEDVQDLVVNDLLFLVHCLYVLLQATVVLVLNLDRVFAAEVAQPDLQAGVEEGRTAQSDIDLIEIEFCDIFEDSRVGFEIDLRPRGIGLPGGFQCCLLFTFDVFLGPYLATSIDSHCQLFGHCVDSTHADAVQSAGYLVGLVVELSAGM